MGTKNKANDPFRELLDFNKDEWRSRAACSGVETEKFFIESAEGSREDHIPTRRLVQEICDACPVSSECLEFAMRNNILYGVWGGMSRRQRVTLQEERDKAKRKGNK